VSCATSSSNSDWFSVLNKYVQVFHWLKRQPKTKRDF
jgi:hypothetical protein